MKLTHKTLLVAAALLACVAATQAEGLNVNRNPGRVLGDGNGHGIAQRGGSLHVPKSAQPSLGLRIG